MRLSIAWFAAAVVAVANVGCKTAGVTAEPTAATAAAPVDAAPPLLIGPEAAAKAPPPVELPAKESAVLCVRTAQHYEKDGRIDDAIKLYEKARTSDPATARQAGRRLAVLYDKAGDFTKSAAEYETQIKAAPNDAELLTDFGYSHYCRGDWASAEAALLRAVQIDANQKRAWVNLGLAQAQLSKWDESFQSFCRAVRPADAHCNVAFVLATQGRVEEAKGRYRQALSIDPSLRIAQNALGALEKPKGSTQKADTPKREERFDPALAASRVPTVAEIEARMKASASETPVTVQSEDR